MGRLVVVFYDLLSMGAVDKDRGCYQLFCSHRPSRTSFPYLMLAISVALSVDWLRIGTGMLMSLDVDQRDS